MAVMALVLLSPWLDEKAKAFFEASYLMRQNTPGEAGFIAEASVASWWVALLM